jgi:hypothetical protein
MSPTRVHQALQRAPATCALQLAPPNGGSIVALDRTPEASTVRRRDLLGGLIHEYQRAA